MHRQAASLFGQRIPEWSSTLHCAVWILIFCAACKSPARPTDDKVLVRPPVNPASHLQLPTDRIYLLGETGEPTAMWWRVTSIRPAPGSAIAPTPVECPSNCLYVSVELGADPVPNSNIHARFNIGLGHEPNRRLNSLINYVVRHGEFAVVTAGPRSFTTEGQDVGIPEYLIVDGRTLDDSTGHVITIEAQSRVPLGYAGM